MIGHAAGTAALVADDFTCPAPGSRSRSGLVRAALMHRPNVFLSTPFVAVD
jgi:hypothetical protein